MDLDGAGSMVVLFVKGNANSVIKKSRNLNSISRFFMGDGSTGATGVDADEGAATVNLAERRFVPFLWPAAEILHADGVLSKAEDGFADGAAIFFEVLEGRTRKFS